MILIPMYHTGVWIDAKGASAYHKPGMNITMGQPRTLVFCANLPSSPRPWSYVGTYDTISYHALGSSLVPTVHDY